MPHMRLLKLNDEETRMFMNGFTPRPERRLKRCKVAGDSLGRACVGSAAGAFAE